MILPMPMPYRKGVKPSTKNSSRRRNNICKAKYNNRSMNNSSQCNKIHGRINSRYRYNSNNKSHKKNKNSKDKNKNKSKNNRNQNKKTQDRINSRYRYNSNNRFKSKI